jgi:uncharacterized protein (TIGR00730 family)
MNITVFGGARPKPAELAYEQAENLGKILAEAGHTVLTGGYCGTMEAASKGAAAAGGHVVGVTCDEIERWRHQGANQWVKEEWRCATLQERMISLMDHCDAAIALPGGAGTLAEITLLWNRLIVRSTPCRLLILVGEGWKTSFSVIFDTQGNHLGVMERQQLVFANTNAEALRILQERL